MTTTAPVSTASPVSAAKTPSQLNAAVNPSEVGWQFVPRYYTFVNKNPGRLHCFYAKNSTFIHGNEGDDTAPCFGLAEIHSKILSLNYNNCKVFINSVDAQSSANNGIIIQVIGEISNNNEPWKKFVQTFFLAEQPNGYFVLNDIFRYLKEESVTEEEEEDVTEADLSAPVEVPAVEVPEPEPAPVVEQVEEVLQEAPVTAVEPSPELSPAEPAKTNGINGHSQPEPEVVPPPIVEESAPVEEAPVEAAREPSPAPPALTPSAPSPVPSASARAAAPPSPVPAAAQAAPPPAAAQPPPPPAPSGPKTWASLAATDNKKWGSRMAQEAKGVSTTVAPTPPPAQPQQQQKPVAAGNGASPAAQAALGVTTASCFVKGVTENVPENALREVLTTRFGQIKELEVVRSKACAFLEFTTVEAARKAILTSLPQNQGGEGGIRIDGKHHTGTGLPPRITVETKKERGDRPPSKPRPNVPQQNGPQHANGTDGRHTGGNRGGRGGFRGGRGGAGPK